MKTISLLFSVFLSVFLGACSSETRIVDTWEVEVGLLEITPFPTVEETESHADVLIAHRYQLLSAVSVDRSSPALSVPQLVILHWAIRDKKSDDELKKSKRGDVKKFSIQRRAARNDLNDCYIKNKFEAQDLFLFVETDGAVKS